MKKNILFLMCDQFRFDCISALGNPIARTPNLDRLVRRGVSYDNAYSTCPVCVAARYTIMTGREPAVTGCYANEPPTPMDNQPAGIEARCGDYLARYLQKLGYRTFGIGKFHTKPDCFEDLGFETQLHTEELWETPEIKSRDAYAGFILREYPEYSHIDQLHGERTNMYYVPQMSPLPKELTVEAFTSRCAISELERKDARPYFGFVSFVGPHPPCAPPAPYHLMYNPDVIPVPVRGELATDWMDEQIPYMNYAIWADDISDGMAKNLISRYYGEISYIDACIGEILDALERRPDADDTVICFFSDHGDHLGDHHAWQKESFFEASTRVPFLISAPGLLPGGVRTEDLACLTDLFAVASHAAGECEPRDGFDLLGGGKRPLAAGVYGRAGTTAFKLMLREGELKYIWMANGGREQLFNLADDPHELCNLACEQSETLAKFRGQAERYCERDGLRAALDAGGLRAFPFCERPKRRIHQFEFSKGVTDFEVSTDNFFCAM